MEEKAPEGGKKGSSTPRKLGTLSSALRVDDTRRLKTLRTSPDLTLGGFPKVIYIRDLMDNDVDRKNLHLKFHLYPISQKKGSINHF